MTHMDPHAITTPEQLRELISPPNNITKTKIVDRLGALESEFIERAPLIFLATADRAGNVSVSPKGDAPGFIAIADERTLLIPDRPGNGLAFGLLNMLENPHASIIFVVPRSAETFRVDGRVELTRDPELLRRMAARNKDAKLIIRVHIERCYFHCCKAFLRSQLWSVEHWPAPFKLSMGEWARQWYGVSSEDQRAIDARIAKDELENL
jgi:PPOX class probable FMN-dependent enzyme